MRTSKDPQQVARARQRVKMLFALASTHRIEKVICDPARLSIIQALMTESLCVTDLAIVIDRAPAATSQHLRVLREFGLVERVRRGTTFYYRLHAGLATEHVKAVLQVLEKGNPASS